ncbi:acyltransferase family protein [Sphingobacterium lactis]|uniref:Peptidoglycan/LPS O-acetylase OafA/YrhL, contains acyltransferase and SGNH-hydrolase domains n=1 Tax=Sphingobacterium lactis TaxID=797291 RepID=A0A1H6CL39_9SPHI|nr:acyltransferase [Sphingobacterium lactis]SEG73423.1 Peptidoglycan/LPS O-acetylase OafA/YrhL, contains acyltransferase and SGNH-hydrolase domains [Sphingobacterium lactis]
MNKKIDSLQFIRAFAAIIVANSHIWNDGLLWGIFNEFGGFGVDLFFVLSGFIMCLTVKLDLGSNFKNSAYFLNRRITRIFPIYLICAIPLLIFVTKAEGVQSVYYYLGNILLLPSFTNDPDYRLVLPPGWTLIYEMFFYYIFSLILLFSHNRFQILNIIGGILVSMVIIVQALGIQGPQLSWANFSYIIGDSLLVNFALGIIVYYIYERYNGKININIFWALLFFTIICGVSITMIYFKIPRFLANGIPAFLAIIVFVFVKNSWFQGRLGRKLVFIGDASYSIYLTHFYFSFFKPDFLSLGKIYIKNESFLINFVGISCMIGAILGGCLFFTFVEKPLIKVFSPKKMGALEKRTQ